MTDATLQFPFNPVQPGVYSVVDTTSLQDTETSPLAIPAIIGATSGGKPNSALYFGDAAALKGVLRSGAALDVARAAIVGGAPRVCVIRIGTGILQATKALAGASGTPVTLTANEWGTIGNTSLKVTIAANNKVTISFTADDGTKYNEVYDLGASATIAQVVAAINGTDPRFSRSAFVTAAATTGTMPLTVAAESAFASGADGGAITATEWTNGLAALETEDVSIVVPATGDATVHAQVAAHCDAMSTVQARRERTALVGAIAGETPAQQVTRVGTLRNKRVQFAYPGMSMFDSAGVLTAYGPFVTAGYTAGLHCALPDEATSLTHMRAPGIVDVERRLSLIQGGDIDTLLSAGITPVAPAPGGGFWYVDSLSTYIADLTWRDFHKVRSIDRVQSRLRLRLEAEYTGRKALTGTNAEMQRTADDELEDMRRIGLIRAFKPSIVVSDPTDVRTTFVTAPVVPVDTNKFIKLTVSLQPPGVTSGLVADPDFV